MQGSIGEKIDQSAQIRKPCSLAIRQAFRVYRDKYGRADRA